MNHLILETPMLKTMDSSPRLLHIENLVLHFRTQTGAVQAVDGVNFDLDYNLSLIHISEPTRPY